MNAYVEELQTNDERALRALEKAKAAESKKLKSGYRYIEVKPNMSILVECDANGEPTAKGREHIEYYKNEIL